MKTLFSILIALSPFYSNAQLDKGQYLIGGNLQVKFTKTEEFNFFSGEIQPNFGYFIKDKLAIGIRSGFILERYFVPDPFRTTNVFLGPFARYYFLNKLNKTNLFADISPAYTFGKYKYLDFPIEHKHSSFSFQFLAGPSIFLNQHTALELALGYRFNSRGGVPDSTRRHIFNLSVGFQIHL